jgi:hypothetical protein
MSRRINEHRPPTTHEWNEFERRQPDDMEPRRVASKPRPRRAPPVIPALTPEQVAHHAKHLHEAVVLLVESLDREVWDARWTNRLMHAHTFAHSMLDHAAQWTPPEAVAASDSPTVHGDSDPQRESETTAVEASLNQSSPEA